MKSSFKNVCLQYMMLVKETTSHLKLNKKESKIQKN